MCVIRDRRGTPPPRKPPTKGPQWIYCAVQQKKEVAVILCGKKLNEKKCKLLETYVTICHHMLPYVTICHHMLPYVTICYHMLPCVTICYHMLPYVTICYHMLPYVTICYHTLPYVTICYHMLPYVTIRSPLHSNRLYKEI